jgi:hypothetical protein
MDSRERFEAWAITKSNDWFGYEGDEEVAIMLAGDQYGYEDAAVHSAWMAWREQERYYNVNNEVTDD